MPGVRRLLFLAANTLGGVAPVLLVLDPGRNHLPVLILPVRAVLLAVPPRAGRGLGTRLLPSG